MWLTYQILFEQVRHYLGAPLQLGALGKLPLFPPLPRQQHCLCMCEGNIVVTLDADKHGYVSKPGSLANCIRQSEAAGLDHWTSGLLKSDDQWIGLHWWVNN